MILGSRGVLVKLCSLVTWVGWVNVSVQVSFLRSHSRFWVLMGCFGNCFRMLNVNCLFSIRRLSFLLRRDLLVYHRWLHMLLVSCEILARSSPEMVDLVRL